MPPHLPRLGRMLPLGPTTALFPITDPVPYPVLFVPGFVCAPNSTLQRTLCRRGTQRCLMT